MLRVFSRLNTHYRIRHNINKSFGKCSKHKTNRNCNGINLTKGVDKEESTKLQQAHQNDVGLPSRAKNRNVITYQPIDYFDTPRQMYHGHVHGHLSWV